MAEKHFLRDLTWLPVHDAFHKFLKYEMRHMQNIVLVFAIYIYIYILYLYSVLSVTNMSFRISTPDKEVDSLLHCSLSPSGLSVVRDPTTGMLLDFTEVTLENIYYIRFAHLKC